MDVESYLSEMKGTVESWLHQCLPEPEAFSMRLFDAMRYSLFSGGKRLRPILLVSTADLFSGEDEALVRDFACAVECIHTYSLIHDDLPAMDDDDMRRGRPTCHIEFTEGLAILAGDALLTLAFELMSRPSGPEHTQRQLQALNEVAVKAGCLGMVGGQSADILASGADGNEQLVRFIHARKTGALISASIAAGAILAGASGSELEALSSFGDKIGLTFQIIDDLLEINGDAKTLGKSVDSDAKNNKVTYPGVIGIDRARSDAQKNVTEALRFLERFGDRAAVLNGIAHFFIDRVN
ncbi:MAG TPA: farnesyl diphosphate synthase [bacterium]|nr:farnesyl diphosphate synthase [bacterium]